MIKDQNILKIINREKTLFTDSIEENKEDIRSKIKGSSILVIGGAGSIGSAVTELVSEFEPGKLHLLDLNENELANVVRKLRVNGVLSDSTELKTYLIDINTEVMERFCKDGRIYDYVFNFSAVKHVRSENNVYSLIRMIQTNILATNLIIEYLAENSKDFKYFCVSTDKAANPVNIMGYTKLIMENYIFSNEYKIAVSSARFANVAFSNGSLLETFETRLREGMPITIPKNIKRYFITSEESARICLLSMIYCKHREILIPNKSAGLQLTNFEKIVENFLNYKGLKARHFDDFKEAKAYAEKGWWPIYISKVDTTGEKEYEEFYSKKECINKTTFKALDAILKKKNNMQITIRKFEKVFNELTKGEKLSKDSLVGLLMSTGAQIDYKDLGNYLDNKV